jgi:diaminopimelate decarboxylase
MHTHIGSGGDPEVWKHCARLSLGIAAKLPDVVTLSLGGGFKVARVPGETSANLHDIGNALLPDVRQFAEKHGRKLHIEVEPGTYLTANAGAIIATVADVVSTKPEGYDFIKLDTGMSEILRPSMYGAQHPMAVVTQDDEVRVPRDYVIVGHCCESGDILSPAQGDPEALLPRRLVEAKVGDLFVIGGAGAYCASMPAKNYNSFPEAPEVLIETGGTLRLIRERQTLDSVIERERV